MKHARTYAEIQEQKRKIISVTLASVVYGLIFGIGVLIGYLNPPVMDYSNMAIEINMPGPITGEIGYGSIIASNEGEKEAVQTVAPAPEIPGDKVKVETPKTKSTAKPTEKTSPALSTETPVIAPDLLPASSDVATPNARESSSAVASAPAAAQMLEPWIPGERGPGSRVDVSNSSVYVPGQGDVPWGKGNSVTISKAEKGSSYETTLGGAQGTVGQTIYEPIYYFMPLPSTVSLKTYESIPDQVDSYKTIIKSSQVRKRTFQLFYNFDGNNYRLKSDVLPENRRYLWEILDDAGYDLKNAEFKQNGTLVPVIVGFTITKDKQLKGVTILQQSGDPEIDKAVLFGFKQAQFWNKTGETVPGRFTYRF